MLQCLGHDTIVGSNDQQQMITGIGTAKHLMDEFLVSRHIHKIQADRIIDPQMRKPRLNGDTAFFFFGKSIRVNLRQGLDQRGLAMIDMTSSCDDHGFTLRRTDSIGTWPHKKDSLAALPNIASPAPIGLFARARALGGAHF